MKEEEREEMKRRCGGSWKLVLRFLLAGETSCRREKSQAIAGPGHSVAVTSKGQVYTFGYNNSGQLGHGHTDEEPRILPVRYVNGLVLQQPGHGFHKECGLCFGADHCRESESSKQQLVLVGQC